MGKRGPIIPDTVTPSSNIFPLSSDHLIILVQYNALRASMTNHILLQPLILATSSPTQECATAAYHLLPSLTIPDLIPPSLHPTDWQKSIPHGSWVDIIPHPCWRDNILLALGIFDEEDEVWTDTIGGLFEGFPDDEIERSGIIAWSPPWDLSGWEMSEGFWRKWGWLMRGFESNEKGGSHSLGSFHRAIV